jgi:ATP-grasp ribosomal peptide maturase
VTTADSVVLVVTRDQDTAADLVVSELHERGARVARLDVADFPEALAQAAYLVPGRGRWTGAWKGEHRDVDLSAVRAVWYRKPSEFRLHPEMSGTERQWAAAEARAGFGGLLAALPGVRWVNHPHRNAEADHKPRQLALADALGLAVPESLLTNNPEHARAFCRAHERTGVVYKPLRGGPATEAGQHVALRATTVTAEEIDDRVTRTAHLFQARVPCAYAARITAVGRELFAVRIDVPEGSTAVDWRAEGDRLAYTPVTPPDQVARALYGLMDTLGLVYSASDWIVTPEGRWVFHGDLNPNGQWAWLQHHTGLPIAAALADVLTQESA